MRCMVVLGHDPVPVGIQDQQGRDRIEGQVGLSTLWHQISFNDAPKVGLRGTDHSFATN